MADTEQRGPRKAAGGAVDAELTERIAALEARLSELESQGGSDDPLDRLFGELVPTEVRGHLRAARKEQLMAARSFLDHWIERLDRKAMPRERRRRESITLE